MNSIDSSDVPDSWELLIDSTVTGITELSRLSFFPEDQQVLATAVGDCFGKVVIASIAHDHREEAYNLPTECKIVIPNKEEKYTARFFTQVCQEKYKKTHSWGTEEGVIIDGEYVVSKKTDALKIEEGTFVHGKLTGKGKRTYFDGSFEEGDFIRGQLTGKGKRVHSDGTIEEGLFSQGMHIEGKRTYSWKSEQGKFNAQGKLDGRGKIIYFDGGSEKGIFRDGVLHGEGKRMQRNGGWEKGRFEDGVLQGEGCITYSDGSIEKGMFRDKVLCGLGERTYRDGRSQKGTFKNGYLHGQGKKICADGSIHQGEFINGKLHGDGKIIYPHGGSSEGRFCNGLRVDSDLSEIGSVQAVQLLFELTDGVRDLGTPLGMVVDFLEKNGFEEFSTPLREVHLRLQIPQQDLEQESKKVYEQLMGDGWSKLLAYGFIGHAMGLNLVPNVEEGIVYCEIFNSGLGLKYHEHCEESGKYQTLMRVEVPIEHFNPQLIESFLNYFEFEDEFQSYDVICGLSDAVIMIPSPERAILQKPQDTDNCTLEWIFAFLKNKMPADAYHEMRYKLFKKCLEEAEKSEEGRKLIAQYSSKIQAKLENKRRRCVHVNN